MGYSQVQHKRSRLPSCWEEKAERPGHGRQTSSINLNHYATKKSVAESMLDVALLMANASQLKAVLEQGPDFKYYVTLLTLISVSLLFQIVVGGLFIAMARKDLNEVSNQKKLDLLNNVATGLVFVTAIVNVFITAFGVQKTGLFPKPN
uniref:Ninjurin 2 n=1 Tax=Erpetoichthys calabaricus TaxID=27687 RepID=A0A8C4RNB1_ERPCA